MDKTSKILIIVGSALAIAAYGLLLILGVTGAAIIGGTAGGAAGAAVGTMAAVMLVIFYGVPIALWIAPLVLTLKESKQKAAAIWAIVMGSLTAFVGLFSIWTMGTFALILLVGAILAIVGGALGLKHVK